jgi:N-succinyldiaminopimelate aminotransferase
VTIFSEMNELALQHNALNLGQGRPDFDGPPEVIEAFERALRSGRSNQYPPSTGILAARQAVAAHTERFYSHAVDPREGVIITPGATEAVFIAVLGLVDRGDEVIVIEPFFDSYIPNITFAGATPVYVPMRPPAWTIDPDELRAAFTPKTRAIIINTPHNPTGRVYSREELSMIAALCIEHDVVCISDEVYEHLVFENARHIPIATLPGMAERTVTVSSMGKTFSFTGWKIGWVYGPPALMKGLAQAHQYVTFCASHPAQEALAFALGMGSAYFEELQHQYTVRRDLLMNGLRGAGFRVRQPEGTYFVMADFSDVFDGDDIEFARHLTSEVGVACIPPTFFYSTGHAHMASTQARFAFCKRDDMLKEAAQRLATLRGR